MINEKELLEKEAMDVYCKVCNEPGFIFVDDPFSPHFIICNTCKTESTYLWCKDNYDGGEIVQNLSSRPAIGVCQFCNIEEDLPEDFYQSPVSLILEKDLSEEFFEKITPKAPTYSIFAAALIFFYGLFGLFRGEIVIFSLRSDSLVFSGEGLFYAFGALLATALLFLGRYLVYLEKIHPKYIRIYTYGCLGLAFLLFTMAM